jgi:hypothetical protein
MRLWDMIKNNLLQNDKKTNVNLIFIGQIGVYIFLVQNLVNFFEKGAYGSAGFS